MRPIALALTIAIATAAVTTVPGGATTTPASTVTSHPALTAIPRGLPPAPATCSSAQDFDAIFGPTWKPGHAPVPAFYDCLLDYSINDDILGSGTNPSNYHPPGHLTMTPASEVV